MTMKLDALLHDIGDVGAGFDLDQFVIGRVDRVKETITDGFMADACYRRGLLDGVALRHIYGEVRGERRR